MTDRRHMPDERNSITIKFEIGTAEGYFIVGHFSDGTPGELFIKIAKEGSTLHGFADAWALAVSLAFQYGMSVEKFIEKHKRIQFEPDGYTNLKEAREARSIVDMIAKFFEARYLPKEKEADGGKKGDDHEQ